MKKLLFALFLALTVLAVSPLYCSAGALRDGYKEFAISGVGIAQLPNAVTPAEAVGTENMKNLENQYDLSSSDQAGLHYARLVIYKDTRDMGPVLSLVDMVEFKPELITMMSNMGKKMISQKLEEQGATLIEWLPAAKAKILNHNGVQMGSRFTLTEKFPLPMFAMVAVYPQDGKLTGLAILCPDTDRLYWQPLFTQLIASVHP